jgi:EAL domain-containing protein (putative c-di-GMP-specific phosphodiesterase class I)
VPPLEFIPLANELGVDHLLTSHVLGRAIELLETISARETTAFRPLTLWLNVTPSEVMHPEFGRLIAQVADRPGITIGIELSPSPPAEDRQAHEILRSLTAAGARVAIGDFGIGNANLTVVPRLAFDAVKLDRALVRQIANNSDAAAMIESLVGLADRLNLETTAQGIETEEQLEVVTTAGCRVGQGYYFAAPTANQDAVARWFRR